MPELKIQIPNSFSCKLNNTEWGVIVNKTIINAQPFLERDPKFFKEYTIHGTDHINRVIKNAEQLIPDEIIKNDELFKAEDAAILLCSIIIHDLGMFIDDSQFLKILKNEKSKISGIKPYMSNFELWEDYSQKAKRFTTEKWNNLLGVSYQELPELIDTGEWTTRDYLIIGEFLRWYHHRFAFEIALSDFMGKEILPDLLPKRSKKLIGLIAYSHGLGIRDHEIEDYCNAYFGSTAYIDDCPVYFLIALLRLADYLDAGVERAPKSLSDVHTFLSETSRKEWILNQNFRYESFGWRNVKMTRSLDMPASPKNTTEFVHVEKMLRGIQSEFDSSAAVLDEMYNGKYTLTVSRITSNILKSESRDTFAKEFFINDTRLSASPDVLPLLIGPLYSNNPAFGVRELIQNSVDACNQREAIEPCYKGKILIDIDTSEKKFIIKDDGIGMNETIILNYYLRAGSSYRNSGEWEEEFLDDSGKTKVIRIGRFGIGALATFLIGDRATVLTRHKDSDYGCEFIYTLNASESINVTCGKNIPIGTSITIDMSEESCLYFKEPVNREQWSEWYRYESPGIEIVLDGEKLTNTQMLPLSFKDEDGWYKYNSKLFKNFIWSYEPKSPNPEQNQHYRTEFICNGFSVDEVEIAYHQKNQWSSKHWSIIKGYGFKIHLPLISLKDYEGHVELDLSRTKLEKLPLEPEFVEEVYKYLIAELLTDKYFFYRYSIWESHHGYIPLAHSSMGYTILARSFILHIGKPIWCLVGNHRYIHTNIPTNIPIGYIPRFIDSLHCHCINSNIINLYEVGINGNILIDGHKLAKCCGCVISRYKIFSSIIPSKLRDGVLKNIYIYNPNNIEINKQYMKTMSALANYLDKENPMFIEYIPTPIKDGENNLMLKMLQKYIPADRNGGWIPYDINERKRLYPEAFEELSGYIKSLKM